MATEAIVKKEFEEGEEYYFFMMNHGNKKSCLVNGTLFKCEECGAPTAVNAPWIVGGATEEMLKEAKSFYESYGDIDESNGDSIGQGFCEECYCTSDKVELD